MAEPPLRGDGLVLSRFGLSECFLFQGPRVSRSGPVGLSWVVWGGEGSRGSQPPYNDTALRPRVYSAPVDSDRPG